MHFGKDSISDDGCSGRQLIFCLGVAVSLMATAARAEESAPSRVHALVNLEFSDKYLTPRGLIVENRGLTIQPLVLGFINVYKGDSWINDVTLVPGVWNNFETRPSHGAFSTSASSWNEIDPIAGISVTLAKNFTWSETYTVFKSENGSFPTSQHLESKLSYDDTALLGKFALHPYFIYWQELKNKATPADVPFLVAGKGKGPGPSYYFDVGITPSYMFKKAGVKLEAPLRVLFPDSRFYGEFYGRSSIVGLYEAGVKATTPIKFMPAGYGNWSFHVGFKYMAFADKNLQGLQNFLAPRAATRDAIQFYGGISIFF